jgi:chromate reductase
MNRPLQVLALCGSLRRHSYNRALLRHAQQHAPEGMRIELHDIAELPLYNEDLEHPDFPDSVRALHAAARDADALLLGVPEYNHGPTGVLKNTLDWLSRPIGRSVAVGKPVGMMGAAAGMFGTVRAQLALRPTLSAMGMHPMAGNDCWVAKATACFDAEGHLIDQEARAAVQRNLDGLLQWARRLENC